MRYLLIIPIALMLYSCAHIVETSGTCVKKVQDYHATKFLFLSPDSNEIIIVRSFKSNRYSLDSFYQLRVNRASIYTHIKRSIFSPKKPIKK